MQNVNKKSSNLSIRVYKYYTKREVSDTLFKALLGRIILHYSLKLIHN